jgi:hypothetical protein
MSEKNIVKCYSLKVKEFIFTISEYMFKHKMIKD